MQSGARSPLPQVLALVLQKRGTHLSKVGSKFRHPTIAILFHRFRRRLARGKPKPLRWRPNCGQAFYSLTKATDASKRELWVLTITGTVGVLLRAKEAGKLKKLKPILDILVQQHNFRLARNLYDEVLRQVGEAPPPL